MWVCARCWDEWERMFLRPPLLQLKDCRRVLLDGVTVRNSPFWNTHILFCEDVTLDNVRLQVQSGDPLDLQQCRRVRQSTDGQPPGAPGYPTA